MSYSAVAVIPEVVVNDSSANSSSLNKVNLLLLGLLSVIIV